MLVQESPIFSGLFLLPNSSDAEGKVDAAPIRLSQVEVLDFERLLELLYPLKFTKFTTGTDHWGESEWKSILCLASMWDMLDIRCEAIAKLSKCAGPATKILLGRVYDHPSWVRDGLLEICLRHEALTIKEAEDLGALKEVVGIAEARQRIRIEVTPGLFLGGRRIPNRYGDGVIPSYPLEDYYQSE
ncbi:hypothetical protein JB92DRAFT_2743713 [Gautieria morchelliformis]|nr:hypothetical protein JB92DRAFT_2743713 [Gautieria morchelliformis]